MRPRPVQFESEGFRLDGDLYVPDDLAPAKRRPALVACSGYTGLKDIHPARFARALVPRGYVCLAFDYRGFGASEGERGRIVPQEQVEDVRAAIGLLAAAPEVDPERIALLGWALGGGIAIAAAAAEARVAAVAAVNPIGDGERSTRARHTDDSWARLLERIEAGDPRRLSPFEVLPLDEVTRSYVDGELYKTPGYGGEVSLESAAALLRFRPEAVVERIAPRPLLLVHGRQNRLYLPSEAEELYRRAREPKRLVLLDGGHSEWMYDDHPTFKQLVTLVDDFLAEAL